MSVLVCVTGQLSCERLILRGAELARARNTPLEVLHVARIGANVLGYQNESEALEYLLRVSIRHGADMSVRRSDDVIGAIEHEARQRRAEVIVAGRAANYSGWDLLDALMERLEDVVFDISMSS